MPSAQTSRSAQSPPELVNGPAAARVDAHLGYSPGPSLIRTEPDALLTGGLGSADVIFSERGRGVEDQVPAGVCLPLEVPEPVSSVQGSGLLEGAPQETYETPSVGPVVDPGPANVNSPADVSNGKLDAHSSPPLRNTAMPEAGLYGCTEERKRAEGAVETATESGGGIEAAETGECAPHGQSPTEDGGDDNKMDVERGTDLRKTELSPKAEGAMGTAPQEAGEREAAGTGEASPLEQSPAEVGGDAMDVDAGRSTDMRQAGPGARAGTRDGCLATGTNGGSESQTNTITNGSADSEWPLGRADGRQLEAGGKKGGYVSDVGAVRTVAQPFLPSKPGNSLSAAPEAAPGPESVETLCQLYISNLIATTLRKELQERLVQMDGAEERFLSEAVDGGPGARGSGSREALAGATDPSLLFPLIPEPELPGPPIAATFANASSLLRAEHGDAAETGAPRCAPELKSGHQQVGDRNQGTKDGGLAGPVGSATEGAVDPVAGGKSLTDMEIKGARAPRETALQATPPMRVDEQELAASPPQETGNVEILPEVGRNGKAADSSNPTHGAGLRQRGVRDATWLGAKQEGGSQQLADWALNSGRKNENSSQAENPEAGAQCGAKNRDLAETGVEGGAKTESTGAGRHTKGVLDAFETFGAASMTEERNFQPGRYVEESTKVSTSQVRGSEVDQRSGNDFLRGFGAVSSGTQPIKEALQEEGTEKGSARDGGEIVVDRLPTGETADGDASRGVEGDEFKNGTGPDSTEDDYTVGLVVGSENWIDWVLSRPEEAFS